jgi:CRISPR-associated endonuclease/helicase Cas3
MDSVRIPAWLHPSPDPDVAPFLHGEKALDAADAQVVWRRDLNGVNPTDWAGVVELAPPLGAEALAMPIAAVKRWLKGQVQEVADLEGVAIAEAKEEKREKGLPALGWCGVGKSELKYPGEIRPGDTIIVPTSYNGADEYGWNPDFGETEDIGDKANNEQAELGMRRPRVRVDLLDGDREKIAELIRRLQGSSDDDPDSSAREEIENMLAVKFEGGLRVDSSGKVITWPLQPRKVETTPAAEETDEDDESSFIGTRIPLTAHTIGVEKRARHYAEGCGLEPKLVQDIGLAAHLHDLGKCDERFQGWLYGGPFAGREFLAKSGERRTREDDKRIRQSAGYPAGARHESASVLAACALGLLHDAHDRDLVLYLIGVHHGYGRPVFPVWKEDSGYRFPVESDGVSAEIASGSELARIDSGWVDRFWALNQKYGYWGLAYLEGILLWREYYAARTACGPDGRSVVGHIKLTGLKSGVPIGFMAALGTLRQAAQISELGMVKLAWTPFAGQWCAVLDSSETLGPTTSSDCYLVTLSRWESGESSLGQMRSRMLP